MAIPILGTEEPWMPLEVPIELGDDDRVDRFFWGLDEELLTMAVRSSGDQDSTQYLKSLLYGPLNTLSSFNDSEGTSAADRISRLLAIIKLVGKIPRWKNEEEESFVAHEIWRQSEPYYYARTRAHVDAVVPFVWHDTDLDPTEAVRETNRVWRRTRAVVGEVIPGGAHPGYSFDAPALAKAREGADRAASAMAEEAVHAVVEGPSIEHNRSTRPLYGALDRISWARTVSQPDDGIYEDLFGFVTPLPSEQSDGKRGPFLPLNTANVRRHYVTPLVRWFIKYQCRLDLNAIHYAHLLGNNLLPSPDDFPRLPPSARRRTTWWSSEWLTPAGNPGDLFATPFRAISGYDLYRDTLKMHMWAFGRKCFPHVLEPLEAMATDASWLSEFPITVEEIKSYIMMTLDETFRVAYYRRLQTDTELGQIQAAWVQRRIANQAISTDYTGALNLLLRERGLGVSDTLLEDAWSQWRIYNSYGARPEGLLGEAYDKTRDKLRVLRTALPSTTGKFNAPPSVLPELHKMRVTVMARYRAWLYGYKPWLPSAQDRSFRNATTLISDAFRRGYDVDGLIGQDPELGTSHAAAMHFGLAGHITADTTDRMLSRAVDSAVFPWMMWFVLRTSDSIKLAIAKWEDAYPLDAAVALAVDGFRKTFLKFSLFAPAMRATLGRPQTNAAFPATYALDREDLERDLLVVDRQVNRSTYVGNPYDLHRQRADTYVGDRRVVWVLAAPWNRRWKSRTVEWTIDQLDEQMREHWPWHGRDIPRLGNLFQIRLPDEWMMRTTDGRRSDSERAMIVGYLWDWLCHFEHDPPRADFGTDVDAHFRLRGQLGVMVIE